MRKLVVLISKAIFTTLAPKMQTSLLKGFLPTALYFTGQQLAPAQKITPQAYKGLVNNNKIIIRILLLIFCCCLYSTIMGQTETQADAPTTFEISDYLVTGLPKKDLSVKITSVYASNAYASNDFILMDFEIDLTENNYFTDVSEKVTGMSGSTFFGVTRLHNDKDYYINAKFGFDNNLLSNETYPANENPDFLLLSHISQKALMKHLSFTVQTKVNNQLIKVKVNLKNPLLQQFIQKYKTYQDIINAEQLAAELKRDQDQKNEDDAFNNNYGYLGLRKNSFYIADVDGFVGRFGHGKIPAVAVIQFDNGGSFHGDVLLKTVKPASFYEVENTNQFPVKPAMPLFEMGILPEGTLIDFDVFRYKNNIIDGKYVQIHLNTSDPFSLDMKNKYEGKINNYWLGLIPLDALDFGNYADMDKYRSSEAKDLVYHSE